MSDLPTIGRELQAVDGACVPLLQLHDRVPGEPLVHHNVIGGAGGSEQAPIWMPGQATTRDRPDVHLITDIELFPEYRQVSQNGRAGRRRRFLEDACAPWARPS